MSTRWDDAIDDRGPLPSAGAGATGSPPGRAAPAGDPVEVKVWLFGRLARRETGNPIVVRFPTACTLRELLAELGRRLGASLTERTISADGRLASTCRVAVNGVLVTDSNLEMRRAADPETVEIIFFREIEGG